MKEMVTMVWDSLFLDRAPYARILADGQPLKRGALIVLLLSVLVAVSMLIGTLLSWTMTPKLDAIQTLIYQTMEKMGAFDEMSGVAGAMGDFDKSWGMAWQIMPGLFGAPSPGGAFANLIIQPFSMLVGWLIYGLLVYLFARMMGGQGSLTNTLAATALAFAPQILNLVLIIPGAVVGSVIGLWMLLCRYVAVQTVHDLTWGRALLVVVLPKVLLFIILGILFGLGMVVFSIVGGAS